MEKIESFKVNHELLNRGIYVSRKDYDNDSNKVIATTFDIRIKLPNREPVMNIAEMHTIEHLGATFLRNHEVYKNETIYFGPMGCRTGFYVIFKGDLSSKDIVPIISEMFKFISLYEGEIPGATKEQCGNYSDMDLSGAKSCAKAYHENILTGIKDENLNYPGFLNN